MKTIETIFKMLNVEILCILFLLFIIVRKFRNREFYKMINQFDGPPTLPIIGNSLIFAGSPTDAFNTVHKLLEKFPSHRFRLWSPNNAYIITGRREDVQVINKLNEKDPLYDFFKDIMGNGILISHGEKWKRRRNLIESALGTKELSRNLLHVFNARSRTLIDEINKIGMGVDCNLWKLILNVETYQIIETIIGTSRTENDFHIKEKYGTGNKRCETLVMKRIYSPWLHPEFIFRMYLYLTKQSHAFKKLRTPFLKFIQKKKQMIQEKQTLPVKDDLSDFRKSILHILLESNELTDQDLIDEIITLIFAGSDTSTCTICFTLLMLAMNQNIQEKVYQELSTVLGNEDREVNLSDLYNLSFMEQCIKETLRLYSPVPVIMRHATTDVELSDGCTVPAGANIVLSLHYIHDNPEYYPNPKIWNPHNFDPDKVANRPVNSFIPFAAGIRMCVGYKYAMISIKVLLTYILRNFKLSTNQTEIKLNYTMVVSCVKGYHVKFEKR